MLHLAASFLCVCHSFPVGNSHYCVNVCVYLFIRQWSLGKQIEQNEHTEMGRTEKDSTTTNTTRHVHAFIFNRLFHTPEDAYTFTYRTWWLRLFLLSITFSYLFSCCSFVVEWVVLNANWHTWARSLTRFLLGLNFKFVNLIPIERLRCLWCLCAAVAYAGDVDGVCAAVAVTNLISLDGY